MNSEFVSTSTQSALDLALSILKDETELATRVFENLEKGTTARPPFATRAYSVVSLDDLQAITGKAEFGGMNKTQASTILKSVTNVTAKLIALNADRAAEFGERFRQPPVVDYDFCKKRAEAGELTAQAFWKTGAKPYARKD